MPPPTQFADGSEDQCGHDNRPGVADELGDLGPAERLVAPHDAVQPIVRETLRANDLQGSWPAYDGAVTRDILNDQKSELGAAQSGFDDAGSARHQRRERERMVDVRALRSRGGMVYRFFLARRITPAAACGDSEYFRR